MAENLSVEAPDFEEIEKEAGDSTADATRLLWFVVNDQIATARRGIRQAQERIEPKVQTLSTTANTNNLSTQGASVLHFTGGSAFDLTGIQAPEPGKARRLLLYNSGAGTITLRHESASSVAANRFHLASGADETVATRGHKEFIYLSAKWRGL